jgi:hypothetical protein
VVPAVVMPSHRFSEHDLFDECTVSKIADPLNFGYLVACKTRGGDSDVLIQRIG